MKSNPDTRKAFIDKVASPIANKGFWLQKNRILKAQIGGRLLLSDAEKATLAEIAHRLGRKALEELSALAKPDTLLAGYRKLIALRATAGSGNNWWKCAGSWTHY